MDGGSLKLEVTESFLMNDVKSDQSFVSRIEDTSEDVEIIQTIVTLAHNLGMDIVAEGVETAV